MVESCLDLEERITRLSGRQLRSKMLKSVNFILDNFGQPKDYYQGTNPKIEKINDKILELRHIHNVVINPNDECMMEKLYKACIGNEVESTSEDYSAFYIGFFKSTWVPAYGDTIMPTPGDPGAYTIMQNTLWKLKSLLETGRVNDSNGRFDEYSKSLGVTQPENGMHYT
jgi:hypothetical protein